MLLLESWESVHLPFLSLPRTLPIPSPLSQDSIPKRVRESHGRNISTPQYTQTHWSFSSHLDTHESEYQLYKLCGKLTAAVALLLIARTGILVLRVEGREGRGGGHRGGSWGLRVCRRGVEEGCGREEGVVERGEGRDLVKGLK